MDRAEFIMIQISMTPQDFVDKYNLIEKAHSGYIFAWETKGIYGLPQAGRIAHDDLLKHLDLYEYHPSSNPSPPRTMETQQYTNSIHLVS